MQQFSTSLKGYVILITILSVLLGTFLFSDYSIDNFNTILFFSILSIAVESLLIPLPNGGAVSVGFAISLASVLIGGPLMAYIVNGLGVLLRYVRDPIRGDEHILNRSIYKTLFNTSQYSISAGIAGLLYVLTGGYVGITNVRIHIIPITILIASYLIINSLLISRLLSLLSGQKFIKILLQNIKGTITSSLAVATIGIIIALAYISYGMWAVILFFGPLLLARYSFKLYMDMRHVYMETIQALTKTVEAKDPYTSGHASRVEEYAVKLARALNLPEKKIENIKTAAILHDIGKIGIEDIILNKPGKLDDFEYSEIQKHPEIGAQIIKDVDFLKEVSGIIKHHHERYDGKGYPEGMKGENIPLEAAILSIADVYDAMTSDRPYRKALNVREAIREIEINAGTQFHPNLAKVFINIIKKEQGEELLSNVS